MFRTKSFSEKSSRVLLWIIPLIWASNYVIARAAHGVIPPNSLAFGRWMTALLLMLPFVWGERRTLLQHAKVEGHRCFVLGALGIWICGAFVYIAGETTTAGNISLIYAAAPVGIAVVSSYVLGAKLTNRHRLGLLSAFAGVLFIIAKGDLSVLLKVKFVVGDLWVIVATASWVAYSILQQRWPSQLTSLQRLFCTVAAGLLILLPFTVVETLSLTLSWISPTTIAIVLAAGIFPGLLSYLAYAFMVRELGANRAGLVLYLGPVYAALIAWWLLGEVPQWFHIVGASLVLPSIYLASSDSKNR